MNISSRPLLFGFATFIALLCAIAPSQAKILLKEKTSYYSVSGNTGQELFNNMLEKGPKIEGKAGHFLATTEIEYDIKNFTMNVRNGRCVTKDFELVVSAKYTYPKWRGSGKASKSTRNAWKKFSQEIVYHEEQHVKIAMDVAKDMAKILKNAKGRISRSCSNISTGLSFKAMQVGWKHKRLQKSFDRRELRRGGRGYNAQVQLIKAN